MKTFLEEIIEDLFYQTGENPGDWTIVFPNKRAGLFLSKYLAHYISGPVWMPEVLSIEDFVYQITQKQPGDKLNLLADLYQIFKKELGTEEEFDRYYFWGEMLLKDFEEVDQYLVNPDQIFTAIRDIKEIDAAFYYLSEEQREVIKNFWGPMAAKDSGHKSGFVKFWRCMYPVYEKFSDHLQGKNYSTPGKIYRQLASDMLEGNFGWKGGKIAFAGFNALTLCEEIIIKWFIKNQKAKIFWDLDRFYIEPGYHEAGTFFRKYMADPDFGPTFPNPLPGYLQPGHRKIEILQASSQSGQALWAGRWISDLLKQGHLANPEKTVIVLPDESMAQEVISSLPDHISTLNVTIGYPVKNAPLFNFFELVIDLYDHCRVSSGHTYFNHAQVIPLLQHPVTRALADPEGDRLVNTIKSRNSVFIHQEEFENGIFLRHIFRPSVTDENLIPILLNLVTRIREEKKQILQDITTREILFYLYRLFNRLQEVFTGNHISMSIKGLNKLFRQFSRMERVSYFGEPLEGIQLMGIIETRNLDFANVILLDVNEGKLPATGDQNSFIPYSIRKVFGLPRPEHNSSIYSYLFYRLLQRAERVCLVYNTEESASGTGDPSRFIQQLRFEQNNLIREKFIRGNLSLVPAWPLVINKNEDILGRLHRYMDITSGKYLTPSALNLYLDCPIAFYFRYVMDMEEPERIRDDFDALIFGNILHKVMERLFEPFSGKSDIQPDQLARLRKIIDGTVQESFAYHFGAADPQKFKMEGRNLIGKEVVKKVLARIIDLDEKYAPFSLKGTEIRVRHQHRLYIREEEVQINFKGIIDRMDEKNGLFRIIDYKTGKDVGVFNKTADLFGSDPDKRNKAVLQTLFYSMILAEQHQWQIMPVPCLFNAREIFREDFSPVIRLGKQLISEESILRDILSDFRIYLNQLLTELFNPDLPFAHRDGDGHCQVCKRYGLPSVFF